MEKALVIGASGGIGAAIVNELKTRGVAVTSLSRSQDGLDVTSEASIAHHLDALSGPFDLIFVATGALVINGHQPEKSLKSLSVSGLADQYAVNAIGPALILKHSLRLLPRRARSVFAVLSARVGSIGDNGLGGWHSYRAAKAGVNQLIHGGAIELARSHKQAVAVCLHPGTVATDFTAHYPDHDKVTPDQAAQNLLDVIAGLTPAQTGGFYDYAGREIPW
ncbi:SDR family NAD(P)-dependent oxidoreductase [Oceaniglobus ichthyenteri]|uniref:SDR family NAD(P)-dependent oxidoreductase n=1 Tax=Oceaniglobus ichthyenteri TaxID=2136177 RepID=UPI000D391A66|nr:SDR family NAD(P)-dependent oxidoreductase [Oceaniglobus ichthyenteri]